MSAWMCTDTHFASIARFWLQDCREEADAAGEARTEREITELLALENQRSLEARYPGDEEYRARMPGDSIRLTPVECLKSIHCYMYQSCEHEGWEASEAYELVRRIKRAAMKRANCDHDDWVRNLPGYDEAPWGLDVQRVAS